MKQHHKGFYLICIFLCAGFFLNAQENNPVGNYSKLDYFSQLMELERAVYHCNQDKECQGQQLLNKAIFQKENGYLDEALKTISRAYLFTPNDSLNYHLRFEAALLHYLMEDYAKADNYLKQINYLTKNKALINNTLALEVLTLNALKKWDEAEQVYNRYVEYHELNVNAASVYNGIRNLKLKNAKKAYYLQRILPGIGYWYVGKFWKGTVSSLMQLSALSFMAYNYLNLYIALGLNMGGMGYIINEKHALECRELAEQRNLEMINAQLSKLIFHYSE